MITRWPCGSVTGAPPVVMTENPADFRDAVTASMWRTKTRNIPWPGVGKGTFRSLLPAVVNRIRSDFNPSMLS